MMAKKFGKLEFMATWVMCNLLLASIASHGWLPEASAEQRKKPQKSVAKLKVPHIAAGSASSKKIEALNKRLKGLSYSKILAVMGKPPINNTPEYLIYQLDESSNVKVDLKAGFCTQVSKAGGYIPGVSSPNVCGKGDNKSAVGDFDLPLRRH